MMSIASLRIPWPALLLACWFIAPPASAGIHRCMNADGTSVYTDRACHDLDAVERLPPPAPATAAAARFYRPSCPRTLQDLVYELTSAIDARDVNRLSSLYDWAGVAQGNALRLMDRLDTIVRHPLVDVQPVLPPREDEPEPRFDADGNVLPPPPVRARRPTGLRLDQTLANGSTPSPVFLGLARQYGCWWIRL